MKRVTIVTSVLLSLAITACGGSSTATTASSAPTTQAPPVAPAAPEQDLQKAVPAPTYAAGSEELAFFNAYNEFRAQAGLGLLAQNTKLDLAAKNHLNYQAQNADLDLFATDPATGRAVFHIEAPSRPGFTGIQELDRAKFVQYPGTYVGETGSFGLGKGATKAFGDLLATVYHRAAFMYQFPRDIGIVVGTDKNQTVIVEFGYETKKQFNASNYFGSYPGDKQTGVRLVAATELPNPFPDITLQEYPTKTSYPVNVMSAEGTTLAVTSFTMTESGQVTALDARLITKDSDPNKYVAANTAFLVGKAPFKPNTTYTVVFSGTVNGGAVNKSWSFTTGV